MAEEKDLTEEACDLHNGEFRTFYCGYHCEIGCGTCMTLSHRTCKDVTFLPGLEIGKSKEFKLVKSELQALLRKRAKVEVRIKKNIEHNEKCTSEAYRLVRTVRADIDDNLDKLENETLQTVREIGNRNQQLVNSVLTKCSDLEKRVNNKITEIEELKAHNLMGKLYTCLLKLRKDKTLLEESAVELEKEIAILDIKFKPNMQLLNLLTGDAKFGSVEQINTLKTFKEGLERMCNYFYENDVLFRSILAVLLSFYVLTIMQFIV